MKKIIIRISLILIMIVFVPIFGISENESVEPKETVIDQFGIDTGMSQVEYDNFILDYSKKYKKIFPKQTDTAYEYALNSRINLNMYKELSLLAGFTPQSLGNHALYSDVIVIGTMRNKATPNSQSSDYTIAVESYLEGEDILKSVLGYLPDTLRILIPNIAGENMPVSTLNEKRIHFLTASKFFNKNNSKLLRFGRSWFLREEKLKKVKEVIEINDSKNFYKRSYR